MYYKYLKYVLEHKKNVFIECMIASKEQWNGTYDKRNNRRIARELFMHAFTHDLSKFSPKEFIPYAKYFSGKFKTTWEKLIQYGIYNKKNSKEYIEEQFNKAWEHHYKHNKHHTEYWVGLNMPIKYIRFMVCDLKAMSRKFGGTAQEYYLQNYCKWDITRETRYRLEIELDLIHSYNAPICECNEEYWMTIDELIKDSEDFFNRNGYINKGTVKNNINDFLKPACDKYGLDIYDLVKNAKK
jgi:hypothetical protein